MPTTIRPQPSKVGRCQLQAVKSDREIIVNVSPEHQYWTTIHTSLPRSGDAAAPSAAAGIVPLKNGFVHTVLRAFQQDLHLELRPDEVWLAILTQFSYFVNGNRAEELRSVFVSHEGSAEIQLDLRPSTLDDIDVAIVVDRMVALVKSQLRDPAIADMLLPRFTTTTKTDAAVAAMAFLGTTKQYFRHSWLVGCGFPSVTLHGEKADWDSIRERVGRLGQISKELEEWTALLDCALKHMMAGFDEPDSDAVKDFWMRAAHSGGEKGSGGLVTLSGWLTAFCFWQADGVRMHAYTDAELDKSWMMPSLATDEWRSLVLDGLKFPVIERDKIPAAAVEVPVGVSDGFREVQAMIIAGLVGMTISGPEQSVAAPVSAWWLLENKPGNVPPAPWAT